MSDIDDENKTNGNKDKVTFKNIQTEDELVIESSDEEVDETIVNLANKNLEQIPKATSDSVKTLVLTKNKIRTLKNLDSYPNLETLQLDTNGLKSIQGMPKLEHLRTLWLNNNELTNLNELLGILRKQTPKLTYLSLLKNPLCPDIFFGHGNDSQYTRYRHTVIFNLLTLKFLDTQEISIDEKQEATKKGKYLTVAKPDEKQMKETADDPEDEVEEEAAPYKHAQPAAFLGKGKIKYDGRESEGNRFILNTDL